MAFCPDGHGKAASTLITRSAFTGRACWAIGLGLTRHTTQATERVFERFVDLFLDGAFKQTFEQVGGFTSEVSADLEVAAVDRDIWLADIELEVLVAVVDPKSNGDFDVPIFNRGCDIALDSHKENLLLDLDFTGADIDIQLDI